MLQAVTASDADFQLQHPGFKQFQAQHALLGAHYAACTHPTQRLLLQGGADLPRGAAGRWVNLYIQQRDQVRHLTALNGGSQACVCVCALMTGSLSSGSSKHELPAASGAEQKVR